MEEQEIKIKIKGEDWKIKIVKEIDKSDSGVDGLTDYLAHTIWVEYMSNLDYFYQVLTHELIHATLYECGSDMCKDESLVFLLTNLIQSVCSSFDKILKDMKNDKRKCGR